MKVLLGTDILLSYIFKADNVEGVELLLKWLDKISATRLVDVSSVAILTNFLPLNKFGELNKFTLLKSIPKATSNSLYIKKKLNERPAKERDSINKILAQLNLVDALEVDYLITENKQTHIFAKMMSIDDKVFYIEEFLEKCAIEYRQLDDSKGVIVEKTSFGTLSLKDPFFQTFIDEYRPYYVDWFNLKRNDEVYISKSEGGALKALLKIKIETSKEDYSDITPIFRPANRMKIASFKVDYNGEKLGERFMRIVFEEAIYNNVDEIYVTLFNTSRLRKRLISLLERWGFVKWGYKKNPNREDEEVYCRRFKGLVRNDLKKDFPFHNIPKYAYIIPINNNYVRQLIPEDTLLNSEYDIIPSKHSIRKVLVLKGYTDNLSKGSVLLFYKISSELHERHVISAGVVEDVYTHFNSKSDFISRCRKRSVLSDEELSLFWNKTPSKPIVVDFIHICDFADHEILLNDLEDLDSAIKEAKPLIPIPISHQQYLRLIKNSKYEKCININKT